MVNKIDSLIVKKNNLLLKLKVADGGDGSGNFGHSGRPGKVGGSSSNTIPKIDVSQAKQFMQDFNISNKQLMSDYSLYPNELMDRVNKQIDKGFSIFKSNEDFERAKSRLTDKSLTDKERIKLQKAINRQNLINNIIEKLKEQPDSSNPKEEKSANNSYELEINGELSTFTDDKNQKAKNEKYIDEVGDVHMRREAEYFDFLKDFGDARLLKTTEFNSAIDKVVTTPKLKDGLNLLVKDVSTYGRVIPIVKNLLQNIKDTIKSEDFSKYFDKVSNDFGFSLGFNLQDEKTVSDMQRQLLKLVRKKDIEDIEDCAQNPMYKNSFLAANLFKYIQNKHSESRKNKSKLDVISMSGKVAVLNRRNIEALNLPELKNSKVNTQAEISIPKDYNSSINNLKNLMPNASEDLLNKIYSNSERGSQGFNKDALIKKFESKSFKNKSSSNIEDIPELLCAMTISGQIYNEVKTETGVHETGIHNLLNVVVGNAPKNDKKLMRYENSQDGYRDYKNLKVGDVIEMDSQHFTYSNNFADGDAKKWFGSASPVRFEIEAGNAPFFSLESFVWRGKNGAKPVEEDEGLVAGPMKIKSIEDKDGEKVIKIEYDWDNHQSYINLNTKSWANINNMYPENK